MAKETETYVEKAGALDIMGGNMGPNGEKMENGHPVTKTVTTREDDDEKDDDKDD